MRRPRFTEGRYLSEAVTLPRAMLALAVLVGITVVGFGTLRLLHEPPEIEARITSVSIDRSDDPCWWVIGLAFTNPNEDAFTVRSVELPGVDDSARAVIGVLEAGGSRELDYRFPLPSCETEPATLGVDELRFSFSPRGSRARYDQSIPAPELRSG